VDREIVPVPARGIERRGAVRARGEEFNRVFVDRRQQDERVTDEGWRNLARVDRRRANLRVDLCESPIHSLRARAPDLRPHLAPPPAARDISGRIAFHRRTAKQCANDGAD
jgi:hypothetical protein